MPGVFWWSFRRVLLLQILRTHQTCDRSNIAGHLLDDPEMVHAEVEPGLLLPRTYWGKEAGLPPEREPKPSPAPTVESGTTSPWKDSKEASPLTERPERHSGLRLQHRTTWKLPIGRNGTDVPCGTGPEPEGSVTQPPRTGPIRAGI